MKAFFWSSFLAIVLSLSLLWLEIPSRAKSVFVQEDSRLDILFPAGPSAMPLVIINGKWTDIRKIFFAVGFRFDKVELRRKFFAGLRQSRKTGEPVDRSYQGIPSIAYYDRFIQHAGIKNNVDPALIKAVIWRESRFDHTACGGKGEIGLMQIMPGTKSAAADWAIYYSRALPSVDDLRDPKLNIDIGSWYLSCALERYRGCKDAVALALCEYNAGPGRAEEWLPDPDDSDESVFDLIDIPSTRQYVKDILKQYEFYKHEFQQQKRN